uniref:Transmembrane 4 L six family member 19 n=1 Tax=Monodelphis domestica TaxID=13616 RepID=A0A5F8GR36_MONDO
LIFLPQPVMACSRSCSRILGVSLGLSALFAAGANLALFFPDWEVTSLRNGLIGKHALRGSGLWGGGLMMLVSLLASCLAFFGAFVCFITSGAALKNGPFCMFDVSWSNETQASKYGYPFQDLTDRNYLYDRFLWDSVCLEPSRAVIWHVTFFSTLLGVSVLQIMLVLVQVINSFLGLFCGFFEKREVISVLGASRAKWVLVSPRIPP